MALSDNAIVGNAIAAESNFGDGFREDWDTLDVETSSEVGNRDGRWKRGFIHANMAEYGFTYGSDEDTAAGDNFVHAAINYETQVYPDTRKPHPSGWSGLSTTAGVLKIESRLVDSSNASEYDWARVKTNGLNADGSDNGVLDRAKRAKYVSEMLSTYGRFAMSFGRFRWRVKAPYGADGASSDVNQRSAVFPAAGWLLQDIPYGCDINGEPLGDGRTTYRPGRPNGGGILHEIDAHENFGESETDVHHTVHAHPAGTPNGSSESTPYTLNRTQDLRDVWCEAGVDVFPEKIAFFVDGIYTHVVDTSDEVQNGLFLYEPVTGEEYNQVMDSANTARTLGRQTNPDGSTRYMKHVMITNLARDGKYPRDLAKIVLDAGGTLPPHPDSCDMEVDWCEARPLLVDNPDAYPINFNGVSIAVDGIESTLTNTTPDYVRTSTYLGGVDKISAFQSATFRATLPETDRNPSNYTYSHSVSGSANVAILGPSDEYEVRIQSLDGPLENQTFIWSCSVNLITDDPLPTIFSVTVGGDFTPVIPEPQIISVTAGGDFTPL